MTDIHNPAAREKNSAGEPSSELLSPVQPASPSYDRLMDVGLDVKLRFGTRRVLLRDVLALGPGVVVELENALHSPVDLLLDGRLIAQGDVVIVDGKYGLRITDIVDPAPAAGSGQKPLCSDLEMNDER
jgi:flagellar motor switch protein FliN